MFYDSHGTELTTIYDSKGLEVRTYLGGLIEIQCDSYVGGQIPAYDESSETWGFPMSLSQESNQIIKNEMLNGSGIMYIRFPMGYAYRGYRNIENGMAKNIGERWLGQNESMRNWFDKIAELGGGLDVEYWSPAPYWLTGGAYYVEGHRNELNAGGDYPQNKTLLSIKSSNPTQYWKRIDEYTDAVINDLEYLHQNVCPVRMYTLGAEPTGGGEMYGHAHWDSTVYCDVFEKLHPKVLASEILKKYNEKPNDVKLHLCSDDHGWDVGKQFINKHSNWIWGYSSDLMRKLNGEAGIGYGADFLKSDEWKSIRQDSWKNVFTCEYEYFNPNSKPDEFKCSNNMVRMISELAYGEAKIVLPIIHICKPMGQSDSTANTKGYAMYAVNMDDGSIERNPWAFNSWSLINDNLPVGSVFVRGGDFGLSKVSYVQYSNENTSIVLCANYSNEDKTVTLSFDEEQTFNIKKYNISTCGENVGILNGHTISFTIPRYSGLSLIN